jgi:hypothetical protein
MHVAASIVVSAELAMFLSRERSWSETMCRHAPIRATRDAPERARWANNGGFDIRSSSAFSIRSTVKPRLCQTASNRDPGSASKVVDFVSFGEQTLGKVRAVLPGDAGDQCSPDCLAVYLTSTAAPFGTEFRVLGLRAKRSMHALIELN